MVEITNLVEPDTLSISLSLIIISILFIFAYIAKEFQHAILFIFWMLTVIILGMIVTVNLEFIWFWILVMIMGGIVGLASVFRYVVVPLRLQN